MAKITDKLKHCWMTAKGKKQYENRLRLCEQKVQKQKRTSTKVILV